MADITLSSAVRNNLLSLQNTSALLEDTQNNLATGLRVNSALDDPSAFFTASSLNSRAGDLNRLLDSVGLAIQTVEAADDGIGAITDLVEAAQASARNALQASGPTNTAGAATGVTAITVNDIAATVTGAGAAITADAPAVVTGTVAGVDVNADLDAGAITDGDTLTISTGAGTTTITLGNSGEDTGAALEIAIDAIGDVDASFDGTGQLVLTGADADTNITVTYSAAGVGTALGLAASGTTTNANNLITQGAATAAQTLTFQVGANAAQTITFGTNDGANEVSTLAELTTAIQGLAGANGIAAGATVDANGNISLTADNTTDSITLGGTATGANFGLPAGPVAATTGTLLNNTSIAQGDNFTVAVGGTTTTLTFGTGAGEINSLAELDTQIDAIDGVSATVTGGILEITNTDATVAATLTDGTNTPLAAFGVTAGAIANTVGGTANATRTAAENEFNNLLTQIDQLAADASFNGNNLLDGDNLTVIFNEDGSSSLAVSGVTFDSSGLGISAAATDAFQTDSNINTTLGTLDTAISTLRTQAATFGSNLSVVQIRQDFTKNLINTLETGAGNLTLADSNLEAANLLALQTRQSLSSSSLSLAARADQNVLQLLR